MTDAFLVLQNYLDGQGDLTDEECDAVDQARAESDAVQRITNLMAEPSWSVGMLEDIAAIVGKAGLKPDPNRPEYYHH